MTHVILTIEELQQRGILLRSLREGVDFSQPVERCSQASWRPLRSTSEPSSARVQKQPGRPHAHAAGIAPLARWASATERRRMPSQPSRRRPGRGRPRRVDRSQGPPPPEPARTSTLAEYVEHFHIARVGKRGGPVKPSTRNLADSELRDYILQTFGTTPLDGITLSAVGEWHGGLLDPRRTPHPF